MATIKIPNLQREGYTLMCVAAVTQREAIGPKSYTRYVFNPWCLVENRDVPEFQRHQVTLGCACNNNQRTIPFFATAEQIKTGQVVPEWASLAWPGQLVPMDA